MKLPALRLRARLTIDFWALLLLLIAVAAVGLGQLRTMAEAGKRQAHLAGLQRHVDQWASLTGLNVERTLALAQAGSPPALREWMNGEMKKTSAAITGVQKEIDANLQSPEERALMERVAAVRKDYIQLRSGLLERLAVPDDSGGAFDEIESSLKPAAARYLEQLDAVRQYAADLSRQQAAESDALLGRAMLILPGAAAFAVLLGVTVGWRFANLLLRVLRDLREAARRIADGDLTQTVVVDRTDELGDLQRSLAQMQDGLRRIVGGIRAGTDGVGTAATQIASGNDDLSARTERAASNLQQTAATMAALSEAMQRSTGSAAEAQRLAVTAASVAERGGEVVAEVVKTMGEINAGSGRISEITGVIDGIAFQTNILALNAAVEAARAGEEGRGFAVVAAEVRSLAQRCAAAAGEIRGLIEDSVRKVESGAKLVQDAGTTMEEIERGVRDVTEAIAGVTAAATAQAGGFGEVNQAVAQLDQITQQNAALVEESAAAAQSLRDQAVGLVRTVASFRVAPGAA